MTTKYHVSPKTGKAAVCNATKRACRYGEHYDTEARANQKADETRIALVKKEMSAQPEPINLADSPFRLPYGNNLGSYASGVEWDYDSYGPPMNFYGEPEEDDDGYNRNYEYEGLRITSVDPELTIRSMLGGDYGSAAEEPLPPIFTDLIKENGWDETDSFTISAERGYYGEEVDIDAPEGMSEKLTEAYWKLPNAVDEHGILKYVRGKGVKTEGLTPAEAIKAQLALENEGRKSDKVDRTTQAEVKSVRLADVKIPQKKHFEEVEGRQPVKPLSDSRELVGVVVKQPDGSLHLVDGYHRMKFFSENRKSRKYANFIVLS